MFSGPHKRFADFHLHSTCSDGDLSPEELVKEVRRQGIAFMSLTDHDTIAGLGEAAKNAHKFGIHFLSGVEISAALESTGTLHILGYGFEPQNEILLSELERTRNARNSRNTQIIESLRKLGLEITSQEVWEEAGADNASLGRPHIAHTLQKKGYVKDIQEAFKIYLSEEGKAYLPKEIYTAEEAIHLIKQAKGKAFVAHPLTLRYNLEELEDYLSSLKEKGLDGIEVYHSQHGSSTIRNFLNIAHKLDLMISGGSDFHTKINEKLPGYYGANKRIKRENLSNWFFLSAMENM